MDQYPPLPHDPAPEPGLLPGDTAGPDPTPLDPAAGRDPFGASYVSADPPAQHGASFSYGATGGGHSPYPPTGGAAGTTFARGPRRPRPWLLIGAAVLVLAALVGGGVVFASSQSSNAPATSPAAALPTPTQARKPAVVYVVMQVSGSTITATTPDGATVTIDTGPATVYMEKGQAVSLSSITPGMRIRVEGKKKNGVIAARKIQIVVSKHASSDSTRNPTATGTTTPDAATPSGTDGVPPVPADPVNP